MSLLFPVFRCSYLGGCNILLGIMATGCCGGRISFHLSWNISGLLCPSCGRIHPGRKCNTRPHHSKGSLDLFVISAVIQLVTIVLNCLGWGCWPCAGQPSATWSSFGSSNPPWSWMLWQYKVHTGVIQAAEMYVLLFQFPEQFEANNEVIKYDEGISFSLKF